MNLLAYKSIYDFAALETAVQSFFVAQGIFVAPPDETDVTRESWTPGPGLVAFFTAHQAPIFQKSRPRVATLLSGIQPATQPPKWVADNNGALRCHLWRATIKLEIVTGPSYAAHNDLRATVLALCEMIAPGRTAASPAIGVNPLLTGFQVNVARPAALDTSIDVVEGDYASELAYELIFTIPQEIVAAVVET